MCTNTLWGKKVIKSLYCTYLIFIFGQVSRNELKYSIFMFGQVPWNKYIQYSNIYKFSNLIISTTCWFIKQRYLIGAEFCPAQTPFFYFPSTYNSPCVLTWWFAISHTAIDIQVDDRKIKVTRFEDHCERMMQNIVI